MTYDEDITYTALQTKCRNLNCTRIIYGIVNALVVDRDPTAVSTLSDDPLLSAQNINQQVNSLHDYGALYSLSGAHEIPINRLSADLDVTDNGNYVAFQRPAVAPNQGAFLLKPATALLPTQNVTPWMPFSITSWLGIASGSLIRFLDTNTLPDIEIRMMPAPGTVLLSDDASTIKYWTIE